MTFDMSSIPIDDDDPFTDYGDERPELYSRDSFMTEETIADDYTDMDEKVDHYGPAPETAQPRRGARDAVKTATSGIRAFATPNACPSHWWFTCTCTVMRRPRLPVLRKRGRWLVENEYHRYFINTPFL